MSNRFQAWIRSAEREHWLAAAAVAAILLLGWMTARELMKLATGLRAAPTQLGEPQPRPVPAELGREIAGAHLFGQPPQGETDDAPPPRPSNLAWTLRAAFAAAIPSQGSALLEHGEGRTRSLRPGQELEPGVVLREVHASHILLEHHGRLERLDFPRQDEARLALAAQAQGLDSSRSLEELLPVEDSAEDARQRRQMIRQRLEEIRQRSARNRTLP